MNLFTQQHKSSNKQSRDNYDIIFGKRDDIGTNLQKENSFQYSNIVIAGNYNQYSRWCSENALVPSEYKYIDDKEKLRGFRLANIHHIGTYHESFVFNSVGYNILAEDNIERCFYELDL